MRGGKQEEKEKKAREGGDGKCASVNLITLVRATRAPVLTQEV